MWGKRKNEGEAEESCSAPGDGGRYGNCPSTLSDPTAVQHFDVDGFNLSTDAIKPRSND